MKINFKAHQVTDREVEFSRDDQVRLFEMMKKEFIEHITYSKFSNLSYIASTDRQLGEFCKDYGVDIEYDKDRVAFFTALVKEMKYQ